MSVGCAKSPQGRRLVRKSVPDGSSDFQRALDHFLSSSESEDSGNSGGEVDADPPLDNSGRNRKKGSRYKYIVGAQKEGQISKGQSVDAGTYEYDDDFEDFDEELGNEENGQSKEERQHSHSPHFIKGFQSKNEFSKKHTAAVDSNNNSRKSICICGLNHDCESVTITGLDPEFSSPRNAWIATERDDLLSPSAISISNSEGPLDWSDIPANFKDTRHSLTLKLPSITAHLGQPESTPLSSMGINCSANLGDARDFSSVLTDGTSTPTGHKKSSKLGGLLAKRRSNSESSDHPADSSGFEYCSCSHHQDGKKAAGQGNKANSSSAKDSNSSGHTKVNKRSSSLPGKSSSKTASSSPQRLLVSRNRSPNGYLRSSASMDAGGDMRGRSHSWSNGRSISQVRQGPVRPITKNSSLFPRTLASSPSGHQHTHLCETSGIRRSSGSSPVYIDLKFSNNCSKSETHKPGCPLHSHANLSSDVQKTPALNVTHAEDSHDGSIDLDFPLLQRPRAASESHTCRRARPQQHLLDLPRQRSNTMSDGASGNSPSSDLDHGVHVHWADEEQGSSLSTSVLLTSIRPRYGVFLTLSNTIEERVYKLLL